MWSFSHTAAGYLFSHMTKKKKEKNLLPLTLHACNSFLPLHFCPLLFSERGSNLCSLLPPLIQTFPFFICTSVSVQHLFWSPYMPVTYWTYISFFFSSWPRVRASFIWRKRLKLSKKWKIRDRETSKVYRGRNMGGGSLTGRDNHKQTDRYKAIVLFHAK